MNRAVLDASAILAFLRAEPGSEAVAGHLEGAMASAVNIAEVGTRLADLGLAEEDVRRTEDYMGLEVIAFDEEQAHAAAAIRDATRSRGLSLGDRACLQLALREGLPALTADRYWAELDLGIDVKLIRD